MLVIVMWKIRDWIGIVYIYIYIYVGGGVWMDVLLGREGGFFWGLGCGCVMCRKGVKEVCRVWDECGKGTSDVHGSWTCELL